MCWVEWERAVQAEWKRTREFLKMGVLIEHRIYQAISIDSFQDAGIQSEMAHALPWEMEASNEVLFICVLTTLRKTPLRIALHYNTAACFVKAKF